MYTLPETNSSHLNFGTGFNRRYIDSNHPFSVAFAVSFKGSNYVYGNRTSRNATPISKKGWVWWHWWEGGILRWSIWMATSLGSTKSPHIFPLWGASSSTWPAPNLLAGAKGDKMFPRNPGFFQWGEINMLWWCLLGGSSQDLDQWLITMVIVSPLRIGLWDPFQMAFPWLVNRSDPNYLLSGMILQVREAAIWSLGLPKISTHHRELRSCA